MVKLRLPRSPFLGSELSAAAAADGNTSRGTRRSRRVQNRRMQQQQQQQQLGIAPMGEQQVGAFADETERRPDNNNMDSSERSGRSSFRRMFASPGKRKPESRGITASIRRARTTASTTTAATTSQATAQSSVTMRLSMMEEDDNNSIASMDGNGGEENNIVRDRNNTEDTVLSLQEEGGEDDAEEEGEDNDNLVVPPLSLLSPNSGTFYGHAAAHDTNNCNSADPAADDHPVVDTKNVLEWMKDDAPPELLPRILSFCGSRRLGALSKVNRKWYAIVNDESVWRVMCEDTHKVS